MNESDLPADLEFVSREPIVTGSAAAPAQQGIDRYQGAILSAPLGLDTDIAHTQLPGANPAYRLMPASIAGNPASNASIQSTAAKTIAVTPGPSTVSAEIELIMPPIFTPVDQTVTLPGPLVVGLAVETPGTFFSVSSGGLSALENVTSGGLGEGPSGSGSLTLSIAPTTATSWGIYVAAYNGTLTTPAGFTAFSGATAHNAGFFNSFTGTGAISISQAVASNSTANGIFAIFNGAIPAIVQQATAAFVGVTPLTKAFTSNNIAGNTIIVIVSAINNTNGPFSLSVSDTAGNLYTTIGYVQTGGVWQPSVLLAIATNVAGSANTVRASITGTPAGGSSGEMTIIEYPPLSAAPAIPVFKTIFPSDVPPINLGSFGNGGVSGILKPVNGGTGSDLSATGGTSLFLSQLSAGAAITPTQPDFGDLAGLNKATKYNNIALVGVGLPSIIAQVDRTAQTAAITTTNLLASVPTTGQYRLSWNAKVTTPDGASSTLGALTITYTDADNTVQTITAAAQNKNGAIETSDTGNTTTTVMLGLDMMLNARSGTAIQYAFAYASGTPATMAYNLHLRLEAL